MRFCEEVIVAQRVDRHLLVSIYEQQRHVCAVRANFWGGIGDEHKQMPPDHPVLIAVTKFMTPFAQAFADGTVLRENLKTERDKRHGAAGLIGVSANRRASMTKRPSANPTVTMDATNSVELEERIVIGEDVRPSDDGYDTSSPEA